MNIAEIEERIEVVRSSRVTPLMFEYELIERARADRQHIVLPEGEEERTPTADVGTSASLISSDRLDDSASSATRV